MKVPDSLDDILCEHCGQPFGDFEHSERDSDEETQVFHGECQHCEYYGAAVFDNGEFVTLNGDAFYEQPDTNVHHGWREEPSVLYKEHYEYDVEGAERESPDFALNFTRDTVHNGYNPTIHYKCSCGREYSGKERLGAHLKAVAANRGLSAVGVDERSAE